MDKAGVRVDSLCLWLASVVPGLRRGAVSYGAVSVFNQGGSISLAYAASLGHSAKHRHAY